MSVVIIPQSQAGHPSACGHFSVSMVVNALTGKATTGASLLSNYPLGSSLLGMLNAESGYTFIDLNLTEANLQACHPPCVMGVGYPFSSSPATGHICAVESINKANRTMVIADPNGGYKTTKTFDFFLNCDPYRSGGVIQGSFIFSLGEEVNPVTPEQPSQNIPTIPKPPRKKLPPTNKKYAPDLYAEVQIIIDRYVNKGRYEAVIYPCVDSLTVTKELFGKPSMASFSLVIPDNPTIATVGDHVRIYVNKKELFFGYIESEQVEYTRQEKGKNYYIKQIKAFDIFLPLTQNYDFSLLKDKTTTEVIRSLCGTYGIPVGKLEDTGAKIPTLLQDYRQSCLSVFNWHLGETYKYTGVNYILYAEEGKVQLKTIEDLVSDVLCTPETCQPVDYKKSIEKLYNCVIILRKNHRKAGVTERVVVSDSQSILRYGRRTKVIEEANNTNLDLKQAGNYLLKYYNNVRSFLTIIGQWGEPSIKGGSTVWVNLPKLTNKTLLVQRVVHKVSRGAYTMDLELFGSNFGEV